MREGRGTLGTVSLALCVGFLLLVPVEAVADGLVGGTTGEAFADLQAMRSQQEQPADPGVPVPSAGESSAALRSPDRTVASSPTAERSSERPTLPAADSEVPGGPAVLSTLVPLTGDLSSGTETPVNDMEPVASTFDPSNDEVYVGGTSGSFSGNGENSGTITVLDAQTGLGLATLDVGANPQGLLYDNATQQIVALDSYSPLCDSYLTFISSITNEIVNFTALNCGGFGLAFDPQNGMIFAGTDIPSGNGYDYEIYVVSGLSSRVVATIPIFTQPYALAYDADREQLFVTSQNSHRIEIVNASTYSFEGNISLTSVSSGAVVDPVEGELFVDTGNNLSVIADTNDTIVASVPTAGALAYDSTDDEVLMTHANDTTNTLSFISGATAGVIGQIPLPLDPNPPDSICYDPVDRLAIVANAGSPLVDEIAVGDRLVVAQYPLSSEPDDVAYDTLTNQLFVTSTDTNLVIVIDAWNDAVTATIPVGVAPSGVTFDELSGDVYVANSGSDNVSIISDLTDTVVGTAELPSAPEAMVFDSGTDTVFVSLPESGSLAVLSGLEPATIANVTLGGLPRGMVYDAAISAIVVANPGTSSIDFVSDTTYHVIRDVPLASCATALVLDPQLNVLFVSETGAGFVQVVPALGTQAVSTIPDSGGPAGIAYDPAEGTVLVADIFSGNLTVINASEARVTANLRVGSDPTNVTYDPATGLAYSTQQVQGTVAILSPGPAPSYPVTFVASGIGTGSVWSVSLNDMESQSESSNLTIFEPNGSYPFFVSAPGALVVRPEFGVISVAGESVDLGLEFQWPSNRYVLTILEQDLPVNQRWSATLVAGQYSSEDVAQALQSLSFVVGNGSYSFFARTVTPTAGFAPVPLNGSVNVSGSNVTATVTFLPGNVITFGETGLPLGTQWYLHLSSGVNYTVAVDNLTASVPVDLPNGTYQYSSSCNSSRWAATPGNLTVNGTAATWIIPFTFQGFNVTFSESGLPTGTLGRAGWTVVLNGTARHATSRQIVFNDVPNGSYVAFTAGPSGFESGHAVLLTNVSGSTSIGIIFAKGPTANLAFREKGLPKNSRWCLQLEDEEQCTADSYLRYGNLTPGTYAYEVVSPLSGQRVDGLAGGIAIPPAGNLTVTRSETITFSFSYPYQVVFSEVGLTGGTWSVTIGGVAKSNSSGGTITFDLPNGTYRYTLASVVGYRITAAPQRVVIDGRTAAVTVKYRPRS